MQKPGFDPHLDLARCAGVITEEEMYAEGAKKRHKDVRRTYKEVNYASVYGAGAPTVARGAGCTEYQAKKLITQYWNRNWSVKAVADACIVKKVQGKMWLFNPISKLWYSLRHDKDRFSTLNQGSGVYCFDTWVRNVMEKRQQMTAQFHDEIIQCIKLGNREACELLLRDAMDLTNMQLNLNIKLDIDVQFGNSYADIH
jgi:DNA polymerase I-like protein with 3'-5' exonuclease and polymerase domains